jgi:hypothetical protein
MEFYFSYYVKTWDQVPKTNLRKNCNGELPLHNKIHLPSFCSFLFLYKSDYIRIGLKHLTFLNKLLFSNKISVVFKVFSMNLLATQHNTISVIKIVFQLSLTILIRSNINLEQQMSMNANNMKLSHSPNNSANITSLYDSTLEIQLQVPERFSCWILAAAHFFYCGDDHNCILSYWNWFGNLLVVWCWTFLLWTFCCFKIIRYLVVHTIA